VGILSTVVAPRRGFLIAVNVKGIQNLETRMMKWQRISKKMSKMEMKQSTIPSWEIATRRFTKLTQNAVTNTNAVVVMGSPSVWKSVKEN
jgi:sulfopyruvate decarboxylase TPP-binding subunit